MKKVILAMCAITVFAFGATVVTAKDTTRPAADIFKSICSTCHGLKGEGKQGLAPALKGSQFVVKSPEADVVATIKDGRTGSAKKYKQFPSAMPAQKGSLSDAEITSVAKYVKAKIQK